MKTLIVFVLCAGICSSGWAQDGFVSHEPRIAYWKIGHLKPIVIVIHGGPAVQHEYLRPEFDSLTQQATVIYYDQRGVGKSDTATRYTWQDHVADLEKIIKTLAGQQKVILAGSSWGSTLAILYTYCHPQDVKGLILTGFYPWEGKGEIYSRSHILRHNGSSKIRLLEARVNTTVPENGLVKKDTTWVQKELEQRQGTPLTETRISCKSAPITDSLSQICTPILLFNGTHTARWDWADHYAKLFPAVEWHTIEDAGHDPWLNNPALFFSISNEFVRSVSK